MRVRIDPAVTDKLDALAKENGTTVTQEVNRAVKQYIAQINYAKAQRSSNE